ncbi:hypothetical protein PR001_g12518 [Phytophthora rubi]|uniref:Uncharacterized protein n=2 Tax=Phytophthora TaxID=4783 RepID=A0A6A3M3I5_9STRA|nr:hypothetical protein PR001_g12518 [Phytophthora rubi]
MMQDETVPITAEAAVDAHAMGMSFNNLNFERTLSLVGFDKLQDLDLEVQHIDLWGCSDGVYDMDVNASINNPSTMGLQGIVHVWREALRTKSNGPRHSCRCSASSAIPDIELGICSFEVEKVYNDSYLGYAYSEKPELGMPRGQSNQTFRVIMSEDSSALEGVITGFFSGGVEVNVRGDNPYSTEYTQFKEAIGKVNMTVEYDDGLDKVSFNTSCVSSFLTVLGY